MHLLLAFAVVLLLAVLISARAERTVLSTAVLFLIAGAVLGSGGLQFIRMSPSSPALMYFAEVALFSVLYTDGMRSSPEQLGGGAWKLPSRALLVGLPLTLLGTALLAHYLAKLTWPDSFLIGAVLSPTDPVFAAAIFRFQYVPARLQRLLNLESGLNDGLALPIIVFLLARSGKSPSSAAVSLGEMALGIGIGIAIPYLFVKVVRLPIFESSDAYRPLAGLAIALAIYGVAHTVNANVFLAAFSGGFTLGAISEKASSAFFGFGELIAELLKLAALLVFGSLLTTALFHVGWAGFVFCILALIAVRPAALGIALYRQLPWLEWIAAAWFGPKGFASVVYGLLILRSGVPNGLQLVHLIGVVITLSIIAHSSTDIVVARWFKERPGGLQQQRPRA